MREEYDFSKGVRGKYFKKMQRISLVCFLVLNTAFLSACSGNAVSEPANANTQAPAEPTPPAKMALPAKFLLVGDSLMIEGFGPEMEKALDDRDGMSVVRQGVYSTGLNRFDFFDWNDKTEELIGINKPDALVVIFGANDGQGITDSEGKDHPLGTPGWSETYGKRVNAYLKRISPLVKKIYWVGHPIPGNAKFMKKITPMNVVFESESAKYPNVVYVNTWDRFAVNGKFSRTLTDDEGKSGVVKGGDGVHVTKFGGKIMAGEVVKAILKDIDAK